MKRTLLVLGIAFVTGCDSSIEGVRSFPSPDGRHELQVVTELQAANDPTPWWQHVSLRKPGSRPTIRGSIAKFEGRGSLEVTWTTSAEVRVVVPQELLRSTKLPPSTTRDGVTIHFQVASEPAVANTPNQAMQRTASKAATNVMRVCHPHFRYVARFPGLAVADLVSR